MYTGERINSISHLIGAALALAGFVVLVVRAALKGDPWKIVSFSIYGSDALVLLYSFSTLYHSLRGKAKKFLSKDRPHRDLPAHRRNLYSLHARYPCAEPGAGPCSASSGGWP